MFSPLFSIFQMVNCLNIYLSLHREILPYNNSFVLFWCDAPDLDFKADVFTLNYTFIDTK